MSAMTMSKVLSSARQLPAESQILLAKELLMGLQKDTPSDAQNAGDRTETLDVLYGLTEEELHALADTMIASDKQQRLTQLLHKNNSGTIKKYEIEELDALLVECQQISLLKAKALLTLRQRGVQNEKQKRSIKDARAGD